jgi:hypothetical protein
MGVNGIDASRGCARDHVEDRDYDLAQAYCRGRAAGAASIMLSGFPGFGKKKADTAAAAVAGVEEEASRSAATAEAVKPNELEELFRASLSAKNEELRKNAAQLDAARRELGKEIGHVALLNAQLAAAEDQLHAKDAHILHANRRILELEQTTAVLAQENELLLMGSAGKSGCQAAGGEEKCHGRSCEVGWGEHDAFVEELTAREAAANRRVAQLEASVAALRQVNVV